jgi:hypothetical protein
MKTDIVDLATEPSDIARRDTGEVLLTCPMKAATP